MEKIEIELAIESGDVNKVINAVTELERKLKKLEERFAETGHKIPKSFNKSLNELDSLSRKIQSISNQPLELKVQTLKTMGVADVMGRISKEFEQLNNFFQPLNQNISELRIGLAEMRRKRFTEVFDKDELQAYNRAIQDAESKIRRLQGLPVKSDILSFEQSRRSPLSADITPIRDSEKGDAESLKRATLERQKAIKEMHSLQLLSYKEALKAEQSLLKSSLEYATSKKEAYYYGRQLTEVSDRLRVLTGDMRSNWEKAGVVIKNTALAMTAFQAIRTLSVAFERGVDTALQMERFNSTLGVLLGNTVQAKQKISELYDFVAKTPLQMPEVQHATQTLLSFGVESENIIPVLKKLGDLARGEEETFKGLALIYGQAKATGRVMTQDLNQFANRGVPLIEEFSKMFKKSGEEIRKMAEEGQLTFPKLDEALNRLTGSGGKFENMMERASQTTSGRLSTLSDTLNLTIAKFVQNLLPFFNSLISGANLVLQSLISLSVGLAQLKAFIESVLPPLSLLISSFIAYKTTASDLIKLRFFISKAEIALIAMKTNALRSLNSAIDGIINSYKLLINFIVTFNTSSKAGIGIIGSLSNAFKSLGLAISTSLGFIGLLGSAIWFLVDAFSALTRQKVNFAQASAEVLELYKEEQVEADKLFEVLKLSHTTYEEKAKAIEVLNELYSSYIPFLLNEASSLSQIALAQAEVNRHLEANAVIKARAKMMEGAQERFLQLQVDYTKALREQGFDEETIRTKVQNLSNIFQSEKAYLDSKTQRDKANDARRNIQDNTRIENELRKQALEQKKKTELEIAKKEAEIQKQIKLEQSKSATSTIEKNNQNERLKFLNNELKNLDNLKKKADELYKAQISGDVTQKQTAELRKVAEEADKAALSYEEYAKNLDKASRKTSAFESGVEGGIFSYISKGVEYISSFIPGVSEKADQLLTERAVGELVAEMRDLNDAYNIITKEVIINDNANKKNLNTVIDSGKAKSNYVKILRLEVDALKALLKPMRDYTHQLNKATEALEESIKRRRERRDTPLELEELPLIQKHVEQTMEASKRYEEALLRLDEDKVKEQQKLAEKVKDAREEIAEAEASGDAKAAARLRIKYKNVLDTKYIQNLELEIMKSYTEEKLKIEETNALQVEAVRRNHYVNMIDMLEEFQKKTLESIDRENDLILSARLRDFGATLSSFSYQSLDTRNTASEATAWADLQMIMSNLLKQTSLLQDAHRYLRESNDILDKEYTELLKKQSEFITNPASIKALDALRIAYENYDVAKQRAYASELQSREANLRLLKEEENKIRSLIRLERELRQNELNELEQEREYEESMTDSKLKERAYKKTRVLGILETELPPFRKTDIAIQLQQEISYYVRKESIHKEHLKKLKADYEEHVKEYKELTRELNELKSKQDEGTAYEKSVRRERIETLEHLSDIKLKQTKQIEKELESVDRDLSETEQKRNEKENKYKSEKKLFTRENIIEVINFFQEASKEVFSFFNTLYEQQISITDRLIDAQKAKVDKARDVALKAQEKGAAEQLQLEEERLEQLNKKRQSFIEDQKNLATVELAVNAAIAVSRAVAEGGGIASVATVALTLASLIAGLAAARAIANSQTFRKGGFTGSKEDPQLVPFGGKGSVGIVHQNEYVFDEKTTKKYKKYLHLVHSGAIDLTKEFEYAKIGRQLTDFTIQPDFLKVGNRFITVKQEAKQLKTSIANPIVLQPEKVIPPQNNVLLTEIRNLRKDLQEVVSAIQNIPTTSLSIDDEGLTARVNKITYINDKLDKLSKR